MAVVCVDVLTDHVILAEGLERILTAQGSFVVRRAIAGSVGKSTPLAAPDIVLIDSKLRDALPRCAALMLEGPPVIFIGAPDDVRWGLEALRAGARGVVTACASGEMLVRAIQTVHQGAMWIPRHLVIASFDHLPAVSAQRRHQAGLIDRLSTREREVFRYAATGLSNKDLAQQLHITEATVKVHLTSIFTKLGIHGRAELAAAYHGIPAVARLQQPA